MNSGLEEEEEYVDSYHVSPEEIVENFLEVSQDLKGQGCLQQYYKIMR